MTQAIVKSEKGDLILAPELEQKIVELEEMKKKIKKADGEIRKALTEAMQNAGMMQIKTDRLTISYIGESDRESFDSQAFKDERPDLYDLYVKFSKVSPSIRVNMR